MIKSKYRDVYVCNNPAFYFYKKISLLGFLKSTIRSIVFLVSIPLDNYALFFV